MSNQPVADQKSNGAASVNDMIRDAQPASCAKPSPYARGNPHSGLVSMRSQRNVDLEMSMRARQSPKSKAAQAPPSDSSRASISAMMAHADEADFEKMAPSERNKIGMYSSRAIARLSRRKERQTQQAVVDKAARMAESGAGGEPMKMSDMVGEIAEKAASEARDIVETEEMAKYDVYGRPCPARGRSAQKGFIMMSDMMPKPENQAEKEEISTVAKEPEPMYASLRNEESAEQANVEPVVVANGAPATPAANRAAAPATAAPSAGAPARAAPASNVQRASEAQSAQQPAAVAANGAAPANAVVAANGAETSAAGPAPVAEGFRLGALPLWALIGLAVLAVFFIGGLIYWLIGRMNGGSRRAASAAAAGGDVERAEAGDSERRSFVGNVGKVVGDVVEAGRQTIGRAVDTVRDTGRAVFEGVGRTADAAVGVGEAAVGTVTGTAGAALRGDLSGAGSAAVGGVANVAQRTIDVGSAAAGGVADTARQAVSGVAGVADTVVRGTAGAVSGVAQSGADVIESVVGSDDEPEAEEPPASTPAEEDEDVSVGTADIEQAFAEEEAEQAEETAQAAEETEEVQERAEQLLAEAEEASAEAEEASAEAEEASAEVSELTGEAADVVEALGDEARAAETDSE